MGMASDTSLIDERGLATLSDEAWEHARRRLGFASGRTRSGCRVYRNRERQNHLPLPALAWGCCHATATLHFVRRSRLTTRFTPIEAHGTCALRDSDYASNQFNSILLIPRHAAYS